MNHTQSVESNESLNGGLKGSRNKPNGIVLFDDEGVMWYREQYETELKRAIWHEDIRDWIIEFTKRNGSYTHGRERGEPDNDITTFHRRHASWGYKINVRPEILFEFEPLERKDPDYVIGPWIHQGCIVLDADNHPVRNFKEIPLACSTKMEPWLQETLRRMHSKITANDFRARMLRDPTGQGLRDSNGNWTGSGKDPLVSAATYDFQMTRFRQKHRCISWVRRGGSPALRDYLWSIMTPEMRRNNTTKGLGDVVDRGELAKMSLANKGKHLSRAGARAITSHERERRLAKEKARVARFDQKQAAELNDSSKQRKARRSALSRRNTKLQAVPRAPTLSRTTLTRERPTQLSQSLARGYLEGDNVEWHKEDNKEEFDGGFGQHSDTKDEKCDEDDRRNFDAGSGDYTLRRSTSAWTRSDQQGRIDDVLSRDAYHTFSSSASHSPQAATWADPSGTFSPGMLSSLSGGTGTPDTLEEAINTNDNFNSYDAWASNCRTALEDGEEFLISTPSTTVHQLLIHHLLEPSREQYMILTHRTPPESDSSQSYLWQYSDLQASLTQWWRSHGQGSVQPIMIGLVGCTSSQLTWNMPTPPSLSVDLTVLLESCFSEDIAPEEAALGLDSKEPGNTWDDNIFDRYVCLDGPGGLVSTPFDERLENL